MVKAVFDIKPDSGYQDHISERYQFPAKRTYLETARQAIGDWIVFREPQRNRGRRAYVATARVVGIEPDTNNPGRFFAYLDSYLAFPTPVPFVVDNRYAEAFLRRVPEKSLIGQAVQGKSMRPLLTEDFNNIVLSGLVETLSSDDTFGPGTESLPTSTTPPGFSEPQVAFEHVDFFERKVEQILLNRQIRDANFRIEVCRAYDNRCAVTGLRIINGGGRAEVQAAHIQPVASGGPDIVQNGIALSATVHWLFDRHLISIDNDYRLLVAHNRVPAELTRLFRPNRERLYMPDDKSLWPSPSFLAHHREAFAGT